MATKSKAKPAAKSAPAPAPVQSKIAEAAKDASAESSTEVKSRGPKGVADSAIVTVLAAVNPKREGSKAHARFAFYKDGKTVAETLDAGVTTPDLVYDAKHGFISIDGYDPGEIVVPKPKAEKKPAAEKTAKGAKVKRQKTAEEEAAEQEAEGETNEETMD